ncbi:MAG: Gfo/Idh/MocA family oxidoreductase [Lentisphaeria bacterium]
MANSAIGTESFATEAKKDITKKIRIALIGCGGISASHINAMKQIPEIELVAGCDINPERLLWFTEQTGITAVYENWDDMLKEENIDAVDVCTPNGVHCPAVCAALECGCHAITEKPMAMNPTECKKMIDTAKKANKLLCVGFQMRYHPAAEMFIRACEAGDIGDILYVKVHALRRRGVPNWGVFGQKDLQGGGPLIDIGVHMIEAAHYCIGEPKPISATGNCWTYIGNKSSNVVSCWPNWDHKTYTVEDLAVGHIRFENGAIMQIESSFCAHIEHDMQYFEIMGTKGGFNFDTHALYTDHAGTMFNAVPGFLPDVSFGQLFIYKLQNFTDAILTGSPLRCPGEEGMTVQKILDGIYRSADKNGAEVPIV